jgi:hypothetical protein
VIQLSKFGTFDVPNLETITLGVPREADHLGLNFAEEATSLGAIDEVALVIASAGS